MQRANILAKSLSSVSSYSTLRSSIQRRSLISTSCSRGRPFLSSSSSNFRIHPSLQTMRYTSSTSSVTGSGTKKQSPSKNRFSSFASKAFVATATVSTTYAAYYCFSSITSVNGDAIDSDGKNGAFKPETKKDEIYGIEYVGFDSYPGIHLDDGTGVATKDEKAASAEVVSRALEAAGLDGNGMMKGIETSEEFITLHPKHAHRNLGLATTCPVYGCPFLPLDVHYDQDVKSKLETMRKEPPPAEGQKEDLPHLIHSSGSDHAATLTLIGYKGGRLEDQINQDRALALAPYSYWNINGNSATKKQPVARLIGAFDGHAKFGEKVSEYVAKTLPALLGSKLADYDAKSSTNNDAEADEQQKIHDIGKILQDTFLELDATSPADPSGGCTASVVLQIGTKIYIANAGDSRSFVAVHITPPSQPDGKESDEKPTTKIIFGTREDKPHLYKERHRVEHMGGTVYLPNGFMDTGKGTTRVLYQDPTTGSTSGLAMSRSIGDWDAGEVGVIPDPLIDILDIEEIKKRVLENLNESCKDGTEEVEIDPSTGESLPGKGTCVAYSEKDVKIFAVSATDGLCDYLPEQAIVNHVAKGLYDVPSDGEEADAKDGPQPSHPLLVCEDLIYAAAQGWQEDKGGRYRDDIAIAVADLEVE